MHERGINSTQREMLLLAPPYTRTSLRSISTANNVEPIHAMHLTLAIEKIGVLKEIRNLDAIVCRFIGETNMNREAVFAVGNRRLLTASGGSMINQFDG